MCQVLRCLAYPCLAALLFSGCSSDTGGFVIRARWLSAPPAEREGLFALIRVERTTPPGRVVAEASPQPLLPALTVPLRAVPVEQELVAIFEVRRAPYRNAALAYLGQSSPFTLTPGQDAEVEVLLQPTTEDPRTFDQLPPRPDLADATYVRAPWGTATRAAAVARARGGLGSVPAGVDVLAFDAEDVAAARLVGQSTAEADGSFQVDIQGTAVGPPPRIFIASGSRDALLSDSSTRAGLQAELVRAVTWTATVRGKVPGTDFPNPHDLRLLPHTTEARLDPSAGGLADGPALQGAEGADGRIVMVDAARRWQRGPTGSPPPPSAYGASAFDPVRGRVVHLPGTWIASFSTADPAGLPQTVWEWDGRAWTAIEPTGDGPSFRTFSSMVFDGRRGQVMLYGGQELTEVRDVLGVSDEMWHFDGQNWHRTLYEGDGPGGRSGHAMAFDRRRGRVVLFGGADENLSISPRDTWEWDGQRWWGPFEQEDGPDARVSLAMAYDPTLDQVVLFGGLGQDDRARGTLWSWDGARWNAVSPVGEERPEGRWGAKLVADHLNRLLLYGGERADFGGDDSRPDDVLWAFEGGTWRALDSTGEPGVFRVGHSMVFDRHRRQLVVTGGLLVDASNDTWVWDGAAWQDRNRQLVQPSPRTSAQIGYDRATGRVVVAGGAADITGDLIAQPSAETWIWTGTDWLAMPADPDYLGYSGAAIAPLPEGGLLLFGGVTSVPLEPISANTLLWQQGDWMLGPRGPPRRAFARAYLDTRRARIMMFGGVSIEVNPQTLQPELRSIEDVWQLSDGVWTEVTAAPGPGPRASYAVDYLPSIDAGVLFGGIDDSDQLGEGTWLWSATSTSWTRFEPPPGSSEPSPRYGHTLTYDPRRGVLVLFGGCRGSRLTACPPDRRLNDVWEFDGTTWNLRTFTAAVPEPRYLHNATYDERLGALVVFGGSTLFLTNELWAYNDAGWVRLDSTAGPQARLLHGMAWDTDEEAVILYGGCLDVLCQNALGDRWAWRGSGWIPLGTDDVPLAVGAHVMTSAPGGGALAWGGIQGQVATSIRQRSKARRWSRADPNPELALSRADGAYVPSTETVLVFGGHRQENGQPDASRQGSLLELSQWDAAYRVVDDGVGLSPAAVVAPSVSFDRGRGQLLLFGGEDGSGLSQATWEWSVDEARWRSYAPREPWPFARRDAALAYDPVRGESVLFSGFAGTFSSADVWIWKGATWRRARTVGLTPTARAGSRLAYDETREALVLFGGYLAGVITPDGSEPDVLTFKDTWLLPSAQGQGPGALLTVDLSAASLPLEAVTGMNIVAWAGGQAEGAEGVVNEVWDHFTGSWASVGSNEAPARAPAEVRGGTDTPEVARRWAAGGTVWARTRAPFEATEAQLSFDGIELTVHYRL